jgi:hypothetical protein
MIYDYIFHMIKCALWDIYKIPNCKCFLNITMFQYRMVLSFKVQNEFQNFNTFLMFQATKAIQLVQNSMENLLRSLIEN